MKCKNYALALWLLMPFAGCASFNDARYEHTQKARARAAWRCVSEHAKQHRYPKDYEQGWKDGFYDVVTGGKGCPPVVAPQKYWRPEQILEDCDNRRHAYYDGFQDGAACASRYPDTHHLKLWSSCECPLPSCENYCPAGVNCPTGSCGFAAIPEGTEQYPMETWPTTESTQPSEMMPAPIPNRGNQSAPALEVIPASPNVSDGAKRKFEPATGFDIESVGLQVEKLNVNAFVAQKGLVQQASPIATTAGPISDPVWQELEQDLKYDVEQSVIPSASDASAVEATPTSNASDGKAKASKSTSQSTDMPKATVATLVNPIKFPSIPAPTAGTSKITSHANASALRHPGMIEQSTVEMASPIVAAGWGTQAVPAVRMATDLELLSK